MEAKKAEFAKFFERLINRVSRKDHASVPPEIQRPSVIPGDPTQPIIQNHSSIAPSGDISRPEARAKPSGPRSSTIITGSKSTDDDTIPEDEIHDSDFTVGRWYPFTFRMMLHKLYGLEEWGEKVKEVLEKSQNDFKPLSEVNLGRAGADEGPQGQTQFKLKQPEVRIRSDSIPGGVSSTRRSPFLGNGAGERIRRGLIATQAAFTSPKIEGVRIVKKRCVGRDKIFTESAGLEDVKPENTWVYKGSAMRQAFDHLQTQRNKKRHKEQCLAGIIMP